MKKKIILLFVVIMAISFFAHLYYNYYLDNNIHIAAVIMGGDNSIIGEDMLTGINLYLDHVNKSGGINGKKVILHTYDDHGDKNTAIKVALEITKRNKALIVLGHYYSSTSSAAGKVYQKCSIPVITGSATAESVTAKNEWYFGIAPNNRFQGGFMANFIKSSLKYNTCSVIYDSDEYGSSLYKSFKSKAEELGLEIKHSLKFDRNMNTFSDQINNIISQMRSASDERIIVLATHAPEGAKILASLQYPGSNIQFIGPDSFSTNVFLHSLSKFPQENSKQGYYSDGVYTTTPFLCDFANDTNHKFMYDYVLKYKKIPTWISACYYDATHMAVKALLETNKYQTILQNRKIIRDKLSSFYSIDTAEKGVCGTLFFDEDRNVKFPLRICKYKDHKLVPDYLQYSLFKKTMNARNAFKNILNNELITSDNIIMNKIRVVFIGVHANQISNIDIHKGLFDIDFLVWIRFKGDKFDEKNILFMNSSHPIELNDMVTEYKEGDNITRVYHAKGTFKTLKMLSKYPFDNHYLDIRIRHKELNVNQLVLVPDRVNELYVNRKLNIDKILSSKVMDEWNITNLYMFNGVVSFNSSFGIPAEFQLERPIVYSTFNSLIKIERNNNSIVIQHIFPAIALGLILLLNCILSFRHNYSPILIYLFVMIVSCIYLFSSFSFFKLPYIVFGQYIYFVFLMGAALSLISFQIIQLIKISEKRKKIYIIVSQLAAIVLILIFIFAEYFLYKDDDLKRCFHVLKNNQTITENSSDF